LPKTLRFVVAGLPFARLAKRIQPAEGLLRSDWDQHPNGGGWVQKTAFVAATAYIGPYAVVSGNARVLDLARIIDDASVTDTALIAGHAVVGGTAHVGGHAKIVGTAQVYGDAQIGGEFSLEAGELRHGINRSFGVHRRRPKDAFQMNLDV
jgi:NDP-sugar pyrophosphorylase family protein